MSDTEDPIGPATSLGEQTATPGQRRAALLACAALPCAAQAPPAGEEQDLFKSQGRGDLHSPGYAEAMKLKGAPVAGYRDGPGDVPDSGTPTFAALRLFIVNWRWDGVPFYLRTGKRMSRKLAEVTIQFKPTPHLLFGRRQAGSFAGNKLIIRIQPDEGIFLKVGAKAPGPSICVKPVEFEFSYEEAFGAKSPPAYGRLLLDAMLGDATLFPREDTVGISWNLLDPFLSRWQENPGRDLFFYPAGSWGPREADAVPGREGRQWRNP